MSRFPAKSAVRPTGRWFLLRSRWTFVEDPALNDLLSARQEAEQQAERARMFRAMSGSWG
ncbi:hypothetical protein [Streptacidiphilus jiangxiensis]|uniref:Uncharacterized protein n=1 Tax=Streptacidiphilus jiangxiensis TaxID=235985 RepID=A0A1H7H199_STRJI|nr:hypothetical protein [Streptacidiphilus jiangxiensis]SEK44091.1 hypothetical protein SAMN05414137_10237 [Streptacidiphilus jiangxiensis]